MEKILKLAEVQIDNRLNPREGSLDQEAITEYAAHVEALPVMRVWLIEGSYYLTRGFHRFAAHQLALKDEAMFEVHEGTWEEAQEDADLDNLQHGLRLTRAEKRAVIARHLKRHPGRSDVWLGRQCHTTDKTIRSVREELEAASEIPRLESLVGTDGVERPRSLKIKAEAKPTIEPVTIAEAGPEWLQEDGFNGSNEAKEGEPSPSPSRGEGDRSRPEPPPPPPPLPPPVIVESTEVNASVRLKEDGSVVALVTRGATMLTVSPERQAELGAWMRQVVDENITMEVAA